MILDAIRDALRVAPFQPFIIRLANGREFEVRHPDFAMISPTERSMMVYYADNDRAAAINVSLVTEVIRQADAVKDP